VAETSTLFEIDVFLQLHVRPEVDELDAGVWGPQPVDAPEALDDAHRVPVDVVVDEPVAVLKILAFRDAVGGDEQVQLAVARQVRRALLGAGREGAEQRAQISAQIRERGAVAAGPGDQGRVDAQVLLRPGCELCVEILGRVGEGGEDENFAVARIDRLAAFVLYDLAQRCQLGVTGAIDPRGLGMQCREPVAVFDEVLAPAHLVHVIEQNLDLVAEQQGLEGGIIQIDLLDLNLFETVVVVVDSGEHGIDVAKLPLDRQCERRHGALHALEYVDAQQIDQAFFAVHLAEHAGAAADPGAVLAVVGIAFGGQHITQRGVGGQVEPANLQVDPANRRKLAFQVHVGLDVDGLQPLRKTPRLRGAVVFLDVLARAGDGQQVQQLEVVEAKHFDQASRGAQVIIHIEPAIELLLRPPGGVVDAGDALVQQRSVDALGGECDLIAQVGEPVVHRGGGQHQHARFDAGLDDAAHKPVVAGLAAVLGGLLVAEVVRLVDDQQVVVAPVDVGQIDIAGQAAVAGQVGMVQNVVIEPIRGEDVAAVVGLVEGPIVAQALRAEDQRAVVAQLVVLDDGQRLEGLTQADAVGDDAAAEAVQFVDGADGGIALEAIELVPDDSVADTGGGLDDALLVQRLVSFAEQVVKDQRIDVVWDAMLRQFAQRLDEGSVQVALVAECIPLCLEPVGEHPTFFGGFRSLNQAQRIAGRDTQAVGAEGERAQHALLGFAVAIADDNRTLRDGTVCAANLAVGVEPGCASTGEPMGLQAVAGCAILLGPQQAGWAVARRQQQADPTDLAQRRRQLREREQAEGVGRHVELGAGPQPGADQVYDAVLACVADELQVRCWRGRPSIFKQSTRPDYNATLLVRRKRRLGI